MGCSHAPPPRALVALETRGKGPRWGAGSAHALPPRARGDGHAAGRFVVIDPYERIVLTWGWENVDLGVPPGSSTVEVTFAADRGGTLVRLTHAGLPPEAFTPHAEGWNHYLDRLAVRAAGGDPGPDPALVAPSFAFPPDTLGFLDELRSNNAKTWFEANRARYEAAYVEAVAEAVNSPALPRW